MGHFLTRREEEPIMVTPILVTWKGNESQHGPTYSKRSAAPLEATEQRPTSSAWVITVTPGEFFIQLGASPR
jgi:hypothetical protein